MTVASLVMDVHVLRVLKIGGQVFASFVTFTIEISPVSTNWLGFFMMASWMVSVTV